MQYASNIVFTNGNLDPWMPAGVNMIKNIKTYESKEPVIQQLSSTVKSLLIDMGGHHLDLFWPTESDPESVR